MSPFEIPPGLAPTWERRYFGLFRRELKALIDQGITPEIDGESLRRGVLVLELDWLLEERAIRLRATYPDGFPRLRPIVQLLGDRAAFPARHCSPTDGNLCLLGRDTRQWVPSMTLFRLLDEQLANALTGAGDEDSQGEPAEFWWNGLATEGSYCLVDSGWDLAGVPNGTLRVRYRFRRSNAGPAIQAAVIEVRSRGNAKERRTLATWTGPLPPGLDAEVTIPWTRSETQLLPAGHAEQIVDLIAHDEHLRRYPEPHYFGENIWARWAAFVYPTELQWRSQGLGWLFPFVQGPKQAFDAKAKVRALVQPFIVRTLRAGLPDLGARVPAVGALREKKFALFGLGALGAPLGLELARNGCALLHIVEHDIVEPGNSIRWPLGASAWGINKIEAFVGFVAREYPGTKVVPHRHHVGMFGGADALVGDDQVLSAALADVDLVVDATASEGVTRLLSDYCRERGLPLIVLYASPSVEGGVVARFAPASGCPNCLDYAWLDHQGTAGAQGIPPPPGLHDGEAALHQPPGCAERTFTGASYDLQELSLQSMRLIMRTIGADGHVPSVVQTLSLVDVNGHSVPPRWREDELPAHAACGCRPAAN